MKFTYRTLILGSEVKWNNISTHNWFNKCGDFSYLGVLGVFGGLGLRWGVATLGVLLGLGIHNWILATLWHLRLVFPYVATLTQNVLYLPFPPYLLLSPHPSHMYDRSCGRTLLVGSRHNVLKKCA